jgi:hypothetical protein
MKRAALFAAFQPSTRILRPNCTICGSSLLTAGLIIERVRAGMRRANLEGRQIGRARLDVDQQVALDWRSGVSLTEWREAQHLTS